MSAETGAPTGAVTRPVSAETDRRIDALLTRFPRKGSALIPALHLIQEEKGYVPEETMGYVGDKVGVTAAFVQGVVTFYTMFHRRPVGRHHVQICRTLSCMLRGGREVMNHLRQRLGVEPGGAVTRTAASPSVVRCLRACDTAPARRSTRGRAVPRPAQGRRARRQAARGALIAVAYEKLLLRNAGRDNSASIETYLANGGYQGLSRVLKESTPEKMVEEVKASGLRGRGGAGFPTGMKWTFLPDEDKPRYLCINADESEPGTFKDRLLIEKDPHQCSGIILSCFAIECHTAFFYIRGEFQGLRIFERRSRRRRRAASRQNILGSGFDLGVIVYRGPAPTSAARRRRSSSRARGSAACRA
jgi:NADH-quinone oxidoreductase subunit F